MPFEGKSIYDLKTEFMHQHLRINPREQSNGPCPSFKQHKKCTTSYSYRPTSRTGYHFLLQYVFLVADCKSDQCEMWREE